jgi:hypothetical protein
MPFSYTKSTGKDVSMCVSVLVMVSSRKGEHEENLRHGSATVWVSFSSALIMTMHGW